MEVEQCGTCGVPSQVTEGHMWLNSGVIVLTIDPSMRMAFVETENLDPLFAGIEKLISTTIEQIVIHAERKGTRDYFNPFIPQELKEMVKRKEVPLDPFIEATRATARINGLGSYEILGQRYEVDMDDYIAVRCAEPYSIPLSLGDVAGGCEAVVEREYSKVTHRMVAPDVVEITASVSGHLPAYDGRLELKRYQPREGDVELEKCADCGAPIALSNFAWDFERGTITNSLTARRMGIIHPSVMDPIFEELERELGEAIPEVVIEAQKVYTKTGNYNPEEIRNEEDFRTQLALRGMGNLRELKMNAEGLRMRLDNVCMHLMIVGLVQGLFELAHDTQSGVEWELSEQGDLEVEITPRG